MLSSQSPTGVALQTSALSIQNYIPSFNFIFYSVLTIIHSDSADGIAQMWSFFVSQLFRVGADGVDGGDGLSDFSIARHNSR